MFSTANKTSNYRWRICAMLFFATTINYMDRQVLSILAPQLQKEFLLSDSQYGFIITAFQLAYALGFLFLGGFIDKYGSRIGYAVSISFWSLAAMLHAAVTSAIGFAAARFALGLGEAGNFPSAVKVSEEWFPKKERALVTGIFVSGSSIGSIVSPLLVPFIAIKFGWKWAFIFTGITGFVWLIFWLIIYKPAHLHPKISAKELAYIKDGNEVSTEKIPWIKVWALRQTWAFAICKFLTDPVFAFFFFFLPKFFYSQFGITLGKIGLPIMIIYIMSDIGSIAGGWLSSFFLKKGWSVNRSRKTTMLIAALLVTPVYFASQTLNLWLAVGLIGLALAAHQAWSANLFTIVTDLFPQKAIGSAVGIGSTLGAIGGMFAATAAGLMLQAYKSYVPLFLTAGFIYLLALLSLQLMSPKLKPVDVI